MTWCGSGRLSGFELGFHTVFFSDDYQAEFAALDAGRLAPDSTLYICAQDRVLGPAPEGALERFLILANAPPHDPDAGLTTEEKERCEQALMERLRAAGLQWTDLRWTPTTPADFAHLFPNTRGALYGRRSRGWRSALQRSGSRTPYRGLYLAGGGVHPGPGVPMAALSGRQAAQIASRDLSSRPGSRPAAIGGGTWTSLTRNVSRA